MEKTSTSQIVSAIFVAFLAGLVIPVFIFFCFDLEAYLLYPIMIIGFTLAAYILMMRHFEKVNEPRKSFLLNKATDKEKTLYVSEDNPLHFTSYKNLLTGQLVAMYKKTHDNSYADEYERRLRCIGFTGEEATNLFMFELMILKQANTDMLAEKDYITTSCFNLADISFRETDEWYIEHQWFLLSEIVKICDEADHLWQTHRDSFENETVRDMIYNLSRYGGAELFVGYLDMMAEKSHTSPDLIYTYARNEQGLLWIYKWRKAGNHPYAPKKAE